MTGAIHPNHECEAASPSRLDAGQRILYHGRPPGLDPETPRGLEKDGGIRLPRQPETLRLRTPHAHLEEVFHAPGREDLVEVPAGGDDGGPHAVPSQPFDQLHGRREGHDAISAEVLEKVLILSVAEPTHGLLIRRIRGVPLGQRDSP